MNDHDLTIRNYNIFASEFADKFNLIGERKDDIREVFSLFKNPAKQKVFELGCGNGRDAKEIIKYTNNYIGIDASSELISIAKTEQPKLNFIIGNFISYSYPKNVNIIFAFASLIHLKKNDLQKVFKKVSNCLKKDGIFRISLKEGRYSRKVQCDKLGDRVFYLYSLTDIFDLIDNQFEIINCNCKKYLDDNWLEITLKKL